MGSNTNGDVTVYLGNREAIDGTERRPLPGKRCTTVVVRDGDIRAAFSDITHPQGVWAAHSDAETPAWVASANDRLASLLASFWGCEKREPNPNDGQEAV